MKKLIAFIIGMLMAGVALAIPTPMPVAVKVTPSVMALVEIKNIGSGAVISEYTNELGELVIDWNNAGDSYRIGDVFRITVMEMSQEAVYTGDPFDVFYFSVSGEYTTTTVTTTTTPVTTITCPDCPSCPSCPDCPSCPVTTTTGAVTTTTCPEEVCPDCPQDITSLVAVLMAVIFTVVGFGGGIKIYKGKSGEPMIHHRHKGIRGYHDTFIMHKNPEVRHKKGELAPKYSEEGVYVG